LVTLAFAKALYYLIVTFVRIDHQHSFYLFTTKTFSMKHLIFICCMACMAACNNAATTDTLKADSSTALATEAATKVEYPYTLKEPYANWQPGDQQHAVNVMKALQAFEKGDVPACMAYFADSVAMHFDYLDTKLSKDSLQKFFTAQRNGFASMEVTMSDWESVISENKKSEYVTLWYKEKWVDKKGKADSIRVVDDCKIVNGKIAELDEKIQHFPAAKK
jgi:hypothetical protein